MQEIKNKICLLKNIELEIKLVVAITDIIMTLYVLWLIVTNTSTWIPGALFGFTPLGAYELFRAGKLFHLCRIYNLMIIHSLLIYCCCLYQAEFGFGEYLSTFRWTMFITGAILTICVIFKLCSCYECSNKENYN